MRGILWKWTNYWNGWQPRWFILDDGVLSYYTSEEEVGQGCKGSVCVSACDINVHSTDSLRLDIVIPGEQHIYVRAATSTERQQWLVALGSAKAQGLVCRTRKYSSESSIPAVDTDLARTKKSELRLYCDLLMQQVHSIKEAVTSDEKPDISKLEESSSLLSATCDTFIKTLDECLVIADASPPYLVPSTSAPHAVSRNSISGNKTKSIIHSNSN